MGDLRIAHPITVPNAAIPAAEIVPALQGLVNAVVEAAEMGKARGARLRRFGHGLKPIRIVQ